MAFQKQLSVIIPTLNEEKNIPELIERLQTALTKKGFTYELIFIDDNSTDKTIETIKAAVSTNPIQVFGKKGKKGKAYSIAEGVSYAKHIHIGIIDADLQYPPEDLAEMALKLGESDVVVAKREHYQASKARKLLSRSFKYIFGKVIFSLPHDIQAGMKVFKKEVFDTIEFKPVSGWTFDLEFLHRASHAGYKITDHPITFAKRLEGKSKVSFLSSSAEIGLNALSVKLKPVSPQHIAPSSAVNMIGAGLGHKRKRFITHTTLPHEKSAVRTFLLKQKIFIFGVLGLILVGLIFNTLTTLLILVATLSTIYFLDVLFNLLMVLRSLHLPQEIEVSDEKLNSLPDEELPTYTILCPMYKEGHILPNFLESISKLDYPSKKLDVILLLEEDDLESQKIAEKLILPSYVRVAVVPNSQPKTKPKACNYGLSLAKGEYLVIYDAEDIPDPLQLKKAYLAFKEAPENVKCLQAKLNYHNPHQNMLTRFFTSEYSLWFDVTLTGYQSLNTSIPLGGTSNHFRTKDLLDLQGWDPFNVTEDADLGTRLFKEGYLTAVINSVTLEEANSKWGNWIRQRSRWIKGYMQTYLVHMRNPIHFTRQKGHHMLFFNLIVGGKIAFILINPFLWLATIAYFALYAVVGPSIEKLYPTVIFYMAVFSLVFGNFLYLFYYMVGVLKREQYGLIKYIFFIPVYWLMISVAGFYAFYQLLFKPHYWEKTTHGLNIKKQKKDYVADVAEGFEKEVTVIPNTSRPAFYRNVSSNHIFGMFLIGGMAAGSVFNFLYNAYLGRVLPLENFALIGLLSSLLSIFWIAAGILGKTVTLQASYLIGKSGEGAGIAFWKSLKTKVFIASILLSIVWVLLSPVTSAYLQLSSTIPLLIFTPVILLGLLYFVDSSFLSARLRFGSMAILTASETAVKFLIAVSLVLMGFSNYAYAAIPASIAFVFILATFLSRRGNKIKAKEAPVDSKKFPKAFFVIAGLTGLSTITFLSLDVVLANHYLPTQQAGLYALTALIGKMILFLAGLAAPFVTPLVSRNEGAKKDSRKILNLTVLGTVMLSLPASIALLLYGDVIIPFMFGANAVATLPFIPVIIFSMVALSLAKVYGDYYLAKRHYTFTAVAVLFSILEIILLSVFHSNIWSFVLTMCFVWISYSSVILFLHAFSNQVKSLENNVADFFGLFGRIGSHKNTHKSERILIFNWRDTRHKWAGGAEVYVQELAKNWVKSGKSVTIFCGNDGNAPRNQVIDGVQIVRRGGFYTVYIWAFIYYILRFRGKFDVIVDAENGIPFFTPFYTNTHKLLLIHHVHQNVFRKNLKFPFVHLALFLEAKLMPFAYRNTQVITVSESSKKEIMRLKLTKTEPVIIHNGVDLKTFKPGRESQTPLILYVGRLQKYKSLHVLINAASEILKTFPSAKIVIAGEGEEKESLQNYAKLLGLDKKIIFKGRVTHEEKISLMQSAWVFVNPSFMEGWGITTIEANACGTPAVASHVPGLRDSVRHNETGFLAKYESVPDFATKIMLLLTDDKLRRKMSKQSILWAENFSWEKSADKFTLLFENKGKPTGMTYSISVQK